MKRMGFVIAAVVLAGAGLWWITHRFTDQNSSNAHQYLTEAVDRGGVVASIEAMGSLEPVELVRVGAQVSGRIIAVHVDFNDPVVKNQLLAQIDPSVPEATLNQNTAQLASRKAELTRAQAVYQRISVLYRQDFVSTRQYDQAQRDLDVAQAEVDRAQYIVDQARVNLGYASITSPIDGVVVTREIEEGQTVASQFETPVLFTIARDMEHMQIDAQIPEVDIGKVKRGARVTFEVDAYPDETFDAHVEQVRLDPVVEQNVVTYHVIAEAGNRDDKLLPGMTAHVHIITHERADVLRVPSAALRFTPPEQQAAEDAAVWVWSDDRLRRISIETGISDGRYFEIVHGNLVEDDEVVVGMNPNGSESSSRFSIGF